MHLKKRYFVVFGMLALPVAIYFVIAERLSWIPRTFKVDGPINDIAFSPDGKFLALGRYDYANHQKHGDEESWENRGRLELWDVSGRRPWLKFSKKESTPVESLFFPNSNTIFYISRDNDALRLNTTTQKSQIIAKKLESYGGFAISPAGKNMVVSDQNKIRFFDSSDGHLKTTWTIPPIDEHEQPSTSDFHFSSDGKRLSARINYDSSFNIFDVDSGQKIASVSSNSGFMEASQLSPDGKTLAFGADSVRLFDIATRKVRATLPLEKVAIFSLAFSPDSQMLAVGNMHGKLTLWNARTGKLLNSWQSNRNYSIDHIAFSPDGRILASAPGYPDIITLRRVR